MKRRILLTGAAGNVGTSFRKKFGHKYEIVVFDKRITEGHEGPGVVGDLTDLNAVVSAAEGCKTIVHLGAQADDADFINKLLPSNIVGTWNVFEAARRQKVKRVIFASTVQVEHCYPPGMTVRTDMVPSLNNMYAASKMFGEHTGMVYSTRYGMSVICLRFGWVHTPEKGERIRSSFGYDIMLTHRDCCEILHHAILAKKIRYEVIDAFSQNAADIRHLAPIKEFLGYTPQDDVYTGLE